MEDDQIRDDEIADALDFVLDESADIDDVLCLVHASIQRDNGLAPTVLVHAVIALNQTARDFSNGGADQVVWNHGSTAARAFGDAWRAVGAVENGDLMHRLADELDAMRSELELLHDPVQAFLAYRTRVAGPFFGIPDPSDELAEALVEWAIEHPNDFF